MKFKFDLSISDQHLNVFAVKGTKQNGDETDELYIYVFTNRKMINNLQSTMEVEVWKLNNKNELKIHAKRQYVPFYIKDA